MRGKVKITYSVAKSQSGALTYHAYLTWGDPARPPLHYAAPTRERAREQVIAAFKDLPEPEEREIT